VSDDEILEILDDHGQVVGTGSKAEIHAMGIRHRSVFVFVFRSSGRLILQQRSSEKTIRPGRVTASACGHVLSGESYLQAAHRELFEELGLTTDLTEVFEIDGPHPLDRELIRLFVGYSDDPLVPHPSEIDRIIEQGIDEITAGLESHALPYGKTFEAVFTEYRSRCPE